MKIQGGYVIIKTKSILAPEMEKRETEGIMYRIYIPVNCDKFYRTKNKQLLLDELRQFDADTVMLNFETSLDGHVILYSEEEAERQLRRLYEACAFFKENGYTVGAWFWGLQFDAQFSFTTIQTLNGKAVHRFACPSDPDFLDTFSERLTQIASTGVDLILLNDDLRFGAWGGFGCVCENHIRMMCDAVGENVGKKELIEKILSGGQNKYRDAFLLSNRRSLENYAVRMREAVDRVNPQIRLGFCACMTSWDIDGDAFDLARRMAGNTRPLLRLIGAPYWAKGKEEASRLPAIVELERMEASWNTDPEIELLAEGDVYPRPRLHCGANYLEGFDMALRASGALDGILRIAIDYVSNVGYEKGYVRQYLKNKPMYEAIEKHFTKKKSTGVRIYAMQHKVASMLLPNALGTLSDMQEMFYPSEARVLASCGIPTVYEGKGSVGIAFGENAYGLPETALENGLILDTLSAKILTERGVDVGIRSFGEPMPFFFQYLLGEDNYIIAEGSRAFALDLDGKVEIFSCATKTLEGTEGIPFCYRYENGKGQKFLVFNCIGKDSEMQLKHYANAKLITDNVGWLSGTPLPAFCIGYPNLYMQCKEDEGTLAIGIWNFFEDEAIAPEVFLCGDYREAEFLFGGGKMLADRLILDDIPPFGFRAILLKKQ